MYEIFLSMYTPRSTKGGFIGGSDAMKVDRKASLRKGGGKGLKAVKVVPPTCRRQVSQVGARQLHPSRNWQCLNSDSSVFGQKKTFPPSSKIHNHPMNLRSNAQDHSTHIATPFPSSWP